MLPGQRPSSTNEASAGMEDILKRRQNRRLGTSLFQSHKQLCVSESSRQLAIFGTIKYFIKKNIVFISAHNEIELNHVG